MGLIITDDLIRRFPFAVNPARMTEDLEVLIAYDMAKAARMEGHFPAMPREAKGAQESELTNTRIQVGILAFLSHGPASKKDIRYGMGGVHDAKRFNRLLDAMVSSGELEIIMNGATTTYAQTNSPTSGDCGPAQPGNTAVNPPQGSDRPCGVEARHD